ncbi:tyrosine-type recombinase/integrase [Paraburkholderia kururiensis]|uniref:Tyrosine-type recombinase/integrase n=1 Tax=Paraburkholderia kururiensis TaxID=984307 RepID=A0ABZ0WNG9_9BURK|nr:tyrosine-type recombinase/integrase [Paraburkholderia kururiensis]WQD78811.1 tyrosine-type recombinase/integrase [Paraburkholderia kururiensis]
MSAPSRSEVATRDAQRSDLFDPQREDWLRDPHAAFEVWLTAQNFRASSADIYRAQWGQFVDWLKARRKNLHTVDMQTIANFVAERSIRKTQKARYLRLIERVLDHVRQMEHASTNPARFIAQDADAAWRTARDNEPTGFLTVAERATLVAYLFTPLSSTSAAQRWRERRDRALVAVFLGGGLKTGEAITLSISCVTNSSPWVVIEAANPEFTRRSRLSPFSVALLDAWLAERSAADLPGPLVFPASPSGRPMHKATVLRAVDAIVEAAGLAREGRASPQTLRNTFAADLFESGVSAELVGQWLGFAQALSAHRLHRAWKAWADRIDVSARRADVSSGDDPKARGQ